MFSPFAAHRGLVVSRRQGQKSSPNGDEAVKKQQGGFRVKSLTSTGRCMGRVMASGVAQMIWSFSHERETERNVSSQPVGGSIYENTTPVERG